MHCIVIDQHDSSVWRMPRRRRHTRQRRSCQDRELNPILHAQLKRQTVNFPFRIQNVQPSASLAYTCTIESRCLPQVLRLQALAGISEPRHRLTLSSIHRGSLVHRPIRPHKLQRSALCRCFSSPLTFFAGVFDARMIHKLTFSHTYLYGTRY